MLARLPRPFAILAILLLVAASVWCLTTQPPPIRVAKKGGYTDVHLYQDITREIVAGKPYHQAAAEMQRLHHYPLKPFITMRLPTLAEMAALIGWRGVQFVAYGLAFAGIFLWVIALEGGSNWVERGLVALALGTGAAMVSNRGLMALHEYWGGLFIAIALAGVVGWPRKWWWQVLPIACGLAIRELTLPFALLGLGFAVVERQAKPAAAWAALIAAFALFLAWHAGQVQAQLQPHDITSAGWHAAQGFSAFLKAVVYTSSLAKAAGAAAGDAAAGRLAGIAGAGRAVLDRVGGRLCGDDLRLFAARHVLLGCNHAAVVFRRLGAAAARGMAADAGDPRQALN